MADASPPSAPRRRRRRLGKPITLMMTPMIDIVFQLIAFFLFALNFEPTRTTPSIAPPVWREAPRGVAAEGRDIVVEIDASGQLVTPAGLLDASEPAFGEALRRQLDEVGGRDRVVLRVDGRARCEHLEPALRALAERKLTNVGLRVREDQERSPTP